MAEREFQLQMEYALLRTIAAVLRANVADSEPRLADITAGVRQIEQELEELNGMNADMAAAILEHAGHNLAALGLPIEIHVDPPFPLKYEGRRPAIAIDEKSAVHHAIGWEVFDGKYWSSTAPGGKGQRPMAPNSDFYSSPEKLWSALRDMKVPSSLIEG